MNEDLIEMTINEKDAVKKFMLHAQIKKTGEFRRVTRPMDPRRKGKESMRRWGFPGFSLVM